MNRLYLLVLFFAITLPGTAFSSDLDDLCDSATIETGILVSHGENVPFWLLSNRYGTVDNTPFNGWLRASLFGSTGEKKKFNLNYGVDIINLYSNRDRLILHQAWVGARLSDFEIQAGKWEQHYGNQDSLLSSGGLLWSGNAPDMPSVEFRTRGFINVPFTHGYLAFKAGILHSWMGDTDFSKNVLLHHKYFYLRTTDRFPVSFSAGLHHYAQWGGISSDTAIGRLPSDFKAFWSVFLASAGSGNSPKNEQLNALGNHLGSYNLRMDVRIAGTRTAIYWQSIFEDNSGRILRNMPDGLWGLSFRYHRAGWWPSSFLVEYIHTIDQSGPPRPMTDSYHFPTSDDNYFNNGIYRDGWSYKDRTIGTPLISSPLYFEGKTHFNNTRIKAFHFGLGGGSPNNRVTYRFLYTFSENFGTYNVPFDKAEKQHATLFRISIKDVMIDKLNLLLMIASDFGEFQGRNTGIQFKFQYILF